MTIGIWTPVAGSTRVVSFGPENLNPFANKLRTLSLPAGTHTMVRVLGCLPVFIHTTAPADDAAGYTGVPVGPGMEFVMPYAAQIWIYSPYEVVTVIACTGAMT